MEKVWRITTPEEKDKADREYYRSLTPVQRLEILDAIREAWIDPNDKRMEKTYRVVTVPKR